MKKARIILPLLLLIFTLCSCTITTNIGPSDLPWYYILPPILAVLIIGYFILLSRTYICPHCQAEFKVKPYQLSVTVHWCRKRLARCPKCGKISFCRSRK